jgi:hypothetical protein
MANIKRMDYYNCILINNIRGAFYLLGIGVEKDSKKGIEILKKLSNKNDNQARYQID